LANRDRIRRLVDRLPDSELGAAERFLEFLNGQHRAGEEELTEQDRAALREGYDDLATGRAVSHEEMRREFGW
jgi:predicted transcriptional regulator